MQFEIKPTDEHTWSIALPDQEQFVVNKTDLGLYQVSEVLFGRAIQELTTLPSFDVALRYIVEYTKYDW